MIKKILKEKNRFFKFAIVGASGTIVNLFFVWLGNNLFFIQLPETLKTGLSFLLGIFISVFTNYIFNYFWTWTDRREKGFFPFIVHLGKYYLASTAAVVLQFVVALSCSYLLKVTLFREASALPDIGKMAASLIGVCIAMLLNFLINHFWTFKEARNQEKG